MKVDTLRLAVMGDKGVGKSALVVRYLTKRFIGNYTSDSDVTYKQPMELPNLKRCVKLELSDGTHCSSLAALSAVSEKKLFWAQGVIIVFSITDKHSFDFAKNLALSVKNKKPKSQILLLGNKVDLEHTREVSANEAKEFANQHVGVGYHEVSAAEDVVKVSEVVSTFLEELCLNQSTKVKRRPSIVHMAKAIGTIMNVSKRLSQESI